MKMIKKISVAFVAVVLIMASGSFSVFVNENYNEKEVL